MQFQLPGKTVTRNKKCPNSHYNLEAQWLSGPEQKRAQMSATRDRGHE